MRRWFEQAFDVFTMISNDEVLDDLVDFAICYGQIRGKNIVVWGCFFFVSSIFEREGVSFESLYFSSCAKQASCFLGRFNKSWLGSLH